MWAQNVSPLPKLSPSHSDDFSNLSTYSSLCFGDAFLDGNGRYWLQVCDPTRATTSFHLFQFDGYQFKLIQGALGDLSVKDKVYGIYKKQELIGTISKEESTQLFFYNLTTDQIKLVPIDHPGRIDKIPYQIMIAYSSLLYIYKMIWFRYAN